MPMWYGIVGNLIVKTMFINSLMPYAGLVTMLLIPWLKQKIDRRCRKSIYATKSTSMSKFKVLYSGADYAIHYKMAGILNIIYMTMMYGTGLPILYPIAAFAFFNSYLCERILVSYAVKLPPTFGDYLSNNLI